MIDTYTLLKKHVQHKINFKTKPLGALGSLEDIALQIACIQNADSPALINPHVLVFAADHGVANLGVSAYPQEVTWQMVMNFVGGGAAINVFCKQNNITLKVIDAGVNKEFDKTLPIEHQKINFGTKPFNTGNAMTIEELANGLQLGENSILSIYNQGCNVVGFGEMGIGNTTSAAAIMSLITKIDIEKCVGKGTGVSTEQFDAKLAVLKESVLFHKNKTEAKEILQAVGGFEITQMVGAMLKAAELNMVIIVDGFIVTSALLIAQAINKNCLNNCLYSHVSNEQGHKLMLEYLNAKPILNLGLRLGEGTGAALAYPIIQSAVNFLNQMASFESAAVSNKN
jgi:nicotinate-nucleotide--dimethylbenzimidazole phosphoribosyltransferase